jgi:hypothetical protein
VGKERAQHCIYTIVHCDDLAAAARKRGAAPFHEKKAWVTGLALWRKAQKAGEEMAVLLGDATDCSKLVYWGLLTGVEVDSTGTTFTVDRLRQFRESHTPQELKLRSTGKRIAENYIRPYAICVTPAFLPA